MNWLTPDITDIITVTMATALDLRNRRLENEFEADVVRVVRAKLTVSKVLWIYTCQCFLVIYYVPSPVLNSLLALSHLTFTTAPKSI